MRSLLFRKTFFKSIFVLCSLGLSSCGSKSPSSFFLGLDSNNSNSISLEEWMVYYGPHEHEWMNCSGSDFEAADCDGNMLLTWPEYYQNRFKQKRCGESDMKLSIYKKPVINEETGLYSLLPSCSIDFNSIKTGNQQHALASTGLTPKCP